MYYRSHTTRTNRAILARLSWAAPLLLLCIAGCQSNAERDLVARDRRMQEDQLYAMEDYISQYQQLVCRYRSENAALRRRLTQDRGSTAVERQPQPMPQSPTSRPATKNGPTIEIPPTPGTGRKRAPTPDLEMPEVPPLKQSTSDEPDGVYQALADNANGQSDQDRYAVATSYDDSGGSSEAATGEAASAAGEPSLEQTRPTATTNNASTETAPDILLTGEVVENDDGGGPRLMVDIEPFDRSGHIGRFDGNLSLMLLTTDADGRQHNLARWDFEPGDVRSATDPAASEPTMRFYVELPAGTPVNDATELWARLMPTGGGKLLSHAPVDLSRAGVFSSRANKIWPSEESVVATNYIETSPKPNDIAVPLNEGSWATAQPGKPANLPPDSKHEGDGWRASSEPAAVVASTTKPAPPRKERNAKAAAPAKHEAKAEAVQQPAWSPDRPGKASNATRPSWSATR